MQIYRVLVVLTRSWELKRLKLFQSFSGAKALSAKSTPQSFILWNLLAKPNQYFTTDYLMPGMTLNVQEKK